MITTSARRALVALGATAALLPAAPALAQTATPTVPIGPTPSPTTTPAPAPITINADRTLIDYGQTVQVRVFGQVGATVRLFGNGRQIRTGTVGPFEGGQVGIATFNLQPGDRTLFYAFVDGRQSASVTVEVRRTVTIGVRESNGVYIFSGQVARAEAGLQVTIARLDSVTKRVTGVASTATTADGRYEIITSLPQGFAGYYALTGVTNVGALQPGRSRLYGLMVPDRAVPQADSISLNVSNGGGGTYIFSGALSQDRSVPVTLARVVGDRLVGVVGGRTAANGTYALRVPVGPGTYFFQVVTGTAKSRVYGLVVPAAAVVPPPVVSSPTTSVSYANCTALRMTYPNGIGRAGAVDRTSGTPVTTWVVNTAGYNRAVNANDDLDRDEDGIACEQA